MSADFTFSMVRHALDTETRDASFIDTIAAIRDGKWRTPIENIRAVYAKTEQEGRTAGLTGQPLLDHVKKAVNPLKKFLPAGTFSGTFGHRANNALNAATGHLCVDLDHLPNVDGTRDIITADPHTRACFKSPTETGLKVIFPIDPARPHIESFRAAEHYVREHFGLEIDPACKEIARLCFMSYDPDAFLAEDAEMLPYPPPAEETEQPRPQPSQLRVGLPSSGLSPGDDFNARGDWEAVLLSDGWTRVGKKWCRPGKTNEVSGTWDECAACPKHFHNFSSTPINLPVGHHSPFAIFAFIVAGGDFTLAAAKLKDLGYGPQNKARAEPRVPDDVQAQLDAANEATASNGHSDVVPDEEWGRITAGARRHNATQDSNGSQTPVDPPNAPKPFTMWAPSQFAVFAPDPSAVLLGDGYLEMEQWTSFVGIGGLGKTRLALWLAICQICGKPWCDLPTRGTPQNVAILSTENGIRRWKHDLERFMALLTDAEKALVEKHMRILALTADEYGDLCLGNPETTVRLKLTLTAAAPGFVIFDPFAEMVDGDENKTVDLVKTLHALRAITRQSAPKAAVLIIHHARTGASNVVQAGDLFNAGNFGRGAKALYSRVRCEIQLAPGDRNNPNRLVMACGKCNDAPKFVPRCVVFDPETFTYSIDKSFDIDAWRNNVTGDRKQTAISIADIVTAVHDKCPLQGVETDTQAIYAEFHPSGVPLRTIQRHIKQAMDLGYLRAGAKRGSIKLGAKPLPK